MQSISRTPGVPSQSVLHPPILITTHLSSITIDQFWICCWISFKCNHTVCTVWVLLFSFINIFVRFICVKCSSSLVFLKLLSSVSWCIYSTIYVFYCRWAFRLSVVSFWLYLTKLHSYVFFFCGLVHSFLGEELLVYMVYIWSAIADIVRFPSVLIFTFTSNVREF